MKPSVDDVPDECLQSKIKKVSGRRSRVAESMKSCSVVLFSLKRVMKMNSKICCSVMSMIFASLVVFQKLQFLFWKKKV